MKYFLHAYRWEIGIFILALLVRSALFGGALAAQEGRLLETISGADGYYVISKNIIEGHGYSNSINPPYVKNSIRPPVFPYFLASLYLPFGSYLIPLIAEMLLGSVIPILGVLLARRITTSEAAPLIVGVLLALEPFSATFSFIFYSETVFTFLFLLSLLFLYSYGEKRAPYLVAHSAIFLALATLTKPMAEYLPVLYIGYIVWMARYDLRRALAYTAVFLVVFIFVLSPWVYRNYQLFGVVGISPQLGEQLYNVLLPSVLSVNNHTSFQHEFELILAGDGTDPNSASLADTHDYTRRAIPLLVAHPLALSIVLGNTALNFFIHDGVFEVLKHLGVKPAVMLGKPALFLLLSDPAKIFAYIYDVLFTPTILILVGRGLWLLITIAFVVGAVRFLRSSGSLSGTTPNAILALGIVMYFMLTTLVIGLAVTSRYRMPVNALIFIFAAQTAALLIERYRSRLTTIS